MLLPTPSCTLCTYPLLSLYFLQERVSIIVRKDILNSRAATINSPARARFALASGIADRLAKRLHFQELVRFFTNQNNLIHNCIKGLAVLALHPKKMPCLGVRIGFAVVAGDVNDTGQLGWDRLQRHALRHGVPSWHHAFARFGRFLAYGTSTVVCRQLSEAVPVNRVSARHFVGCRARAEQVLLTNGTV